MRKPHPGAGARFHRLGRVLAPLLTLSLLGAGVAACGDSGTGAKNGKVTLTVGLFGDFGFQPLYEEYKKSHPNIQIKERTAEYADHHKNIAAHLATNTGAADIEAVELGYISQFTAQPNRFVNLADHGASDLESKFLPWKWKQGLSADGKSLVGLGTDVGSLAMCYRTDLFAAAGLPTARDEVSRLWPTWTDYLEVGKRFKTKVPKTAFYESSGNVFRAQVGQAPLGAYDEKDNLIVDTNPDFKKSFDLTAQMVKANLSAKLTPFSPEWTAGFGQGSFATVPCPAWMTAYIETNAKNSATKWDVAAVPGGSGNVGGSHLTVPKQSKNQKEAAELVKWLVAPEQQAKVFKAKGNFPSTPELYDTPDIKGFSKPFFNNAPIGQIFGDAAKKVKPQYLGSKDGDVMTAVGQALGRIEDGKETPQQAWDSAVKDSKKIAK
jgi:cellobiose transport system substrate-binding protein